jgi:hypothetical protein
VPIEVAKSMLEPTLGWEKSSEVVQEAARELGIAGSTLTLAQILRIFESLGMRSDLVGVAARFARTRLEGNAIPGSTDERSKSVRPSAPPPAPELGRWIALGEIVDLFSPALGVDKSTSLVTTAASELGLVINQLDMHSALAIIDRLTKSEGLVGVVAKFAKAQLILKVTDEAAEKLLARSRPPPNESPPTARTGQTIRPSAQEEANKMGKLDQLAREAGVAWVEWLHEDFDQRKAELPQVFPETHHGARVWLMRSLPRASREALTEVDLDRMVRILFESARREWEGTASSRTDP